MVRFLCLSFLPFAACGPSTTGPAEITTAGLTYDVRNGGSFVGLALTQPDALPSGTASYTGVYQMQLDEFLEKGTATLELDMMAAGFELQMRAEFPDAAPRQVVDLTFEGDVANGRLSHSSLQLDPLTSSSEQIAEVSADFYGDDGSVIAGHYSQFLGSVSAGDLVFGTFIVADD